MSKTMENIIVAVVALALIITLFAVVGWYNLEYWLKSPLRWDDPSTLSFSLVDKTESRDTIELTFRITNHSDKQVNRSSIYVSSGFSTIEIHTVGISPGESVEVSEDFEADGWNKQFYNAIKGKYKSQLNLKYHIKKLSVKTGYSSREEVIVDKSGTVKNLLLLGLSLAAGLAGFGDVVPWQWLRMLLKILGTPALLLLFGLMLVVATGGGRSEASAVNADRNARRQAATRYKQKADRKAGALMQGRTADAARTQASMDRDMADMITGSSDSVAKQNYKRNAQLKANAVIRGSTQDEARAQAAMDRNMAEMIADEKRHKNK